MSELPNSSKERKKYLDAAKGWGITMVVFGHITSLGNPIDLWFAAYKIPIFFIVSGYLLCMRQSFRKMSASQYIWKHFKSLMIPYFGYSAIVMLYNMLVCLMKGTGRAQMYSKFVYQAYTTLSLRGISALWFLPALFFAQVIFILVMKAKSNLVRIASGILSVVITVYTSDTLLPMLKAMLTERQYKIVSFPILAVSKGILGFWFIGAGYLCFMLFSKIKERNLRFVIGAVMFVATIFLSQRNLHVDINLLRIGDSHYLEFAGKNSLIIMATHGTLGFKVLVIKGWKAIYTLSETAGPRYYLECTGILAELMLIECGVVSIINQYFPWLTGKFKKKN